MKSLIHKQWGDHDWFATRVRVHFIDSSVRHVLRLGLGRLGLIGGNEFRVRAGINAEISKDTNRFNNS